MRRFLFTVCMLFLALPSPALGQAMFLCESFPRGSAVVPPTGSPGGAELRAQFAACDGCDCEGGAAEDSVVFVIQYQLLEGIPTGAALYIGEAGENGTLYRDLSPSYFASGDSLYARIAPGDCTMLFAGDCYVVIQTDTYPDGEVRGQLHCFVTPVEKKSWGSVRTLFR